MLLDDTDKSGLTLSGTMDCNLELIGGNLAPDQRVFILAYRPDVEPTEDEKSAARHRIQELLVKSHENAHNADVDADEIDAAIAEAIRSTDD